jgi:hypothetical protein
MSPNDSEVPTPAKYFAWRTHQFAEDTDGLALFNYVNEVPPEDAVQRPMSWIC